MDMSEEAKSRGEIMRNAQRLVHTRGEEALDYAQTMAKRMQEQGDEKDHAFWDRIAKQVELLLHEPP